MKTKKLLALMALTAAGAASAVTVDSANTLCRIEVASSLKNTIVSVPLKSVGGENNAIKLTDLVLTDNLSDGDLLLHNTTSGWECWSVIGGAWVAASVSEANVTTKAGSDAELPVGDAFWLVRNDPSKSFYLYGEVIDTTVTPTINRSSSGAVYTMMANPNLEDTAIAALTFTGTPAKGDKIMVPADNVNMGMKEYIYSETMKTWTEIVISKDDKGVADAVVQETSATIPAGQGFWYVAKKSSTAN